MVSAQFAVHILVYGTVNCVPLNVCWSSEF